MSSTSHSPELPTTLQRATEDLQHINNLLVSGADLDPGVLTDFRNAVNRVRTTAWGVQQYAATAEKDPEPVLSILAAERVRVAYLMCKQVLEDLNNPDIRLQKGQLLRLQDVAKELGGRLDQIANE